MTIYERRKIPVNDDLCDVDGTIVEVLAAPKTGRNQIVALVRPADEPTTAPATTFTCDDPPEGVEQPDKDTLWCIATKDDGSRCTREVDAPNTTCWQHPHPEE